MKYSRFRMTERMSVPLNEKMIILNKLKWGDRLLLLYGNNVKTRPLFLQYITNGLDNGDLCLYAFDANMDKVSSFEKKSNLHLLPLENEKSNLLKKLNSRLMQMYSAVKSGKFNGLRIIIDFGNLASTLNLKDITALEKEIIRKTKESARLIRRPWSKLHFKHYKSLSEESFPIISLTAYNTASIDSQGMKVLTSMHDRVVFSVENKFTTLLPNFIASQDLGTESSLDSISEDTVKDFVKNNLKNIILLTLSKEGMCGYDIIKAVSRQYHVFLTQATVYSTLYSLKKEGILKSNIMPDNKTKVFILNDMSSGKKMDAARNKLRDFSKVLEHTYALLKSNIGSMGGADDDIAQNKSIKAK